GVGEKQVAVAPEQLARLAPWAVAGPGWHPNAPAGSHRRAAPGGGLVAWWPPWGWRAGSVSQRLGFVRHFHRANPVGPLALSPGTRPALSAPSRRAPSPPAKAIPGRLRWEVGQPPGPAPTPLVCPETILNLPSRR